MPPMGDDGLVIGGALQFLLERDGLATWLSHRQRLTNVYWGGAHDTSADKRVRQRPWCRARQRRSGWLCAADWLSQGRIGAIYTGPHGVWPARPRGAQHTRQSRQIPQINRKAEPPAEAQRIHAVRSRDQHEQDAAEVFDLGNVNRYAARFMTISCGVRRPWRDRIPGVVHIDGSARPQLINRAENPCYFDILAGVQGAHRIAGAGEHQPQRSRGADRQSTRGMPQDPRRKGRVDFVVTPDSLWPGLG